MIMCRCGKCGNLFIFKQNEDGMSLEIDFYDKEIRFICQNDKCKHENKFDFEGWQKVSQRSPLPRPIMGGGM